jgi:hypothetical protein
MDFDVHARKIILKWYQESAGNVHQTKHGMEDNALLPDSAFLDLNGILYDFVAKLGRIIVDQMPNGMVTSVSVWEVTIK